ncbi:MAG: hypothetical protein ACC628_20375 [Pirellulaceae bacterium]
MTARIDFGLARRTDIDELVGYNALADVFWSCHVCAEVKVMYRGTIKNGVVVFNDHVELPDGAAVRIELIGSQHGDEPIAEKITLYERLESVAGMAKGLAPDLAENHDHYLHGHPKK